MEIYFKSKSILAWGIHKRNKKAPIIIKTIKLTESERRIRGLSQSKKGSSIA